MQNKIKIVIGEMQGGKSFYINKILEKYNKKGWSGLVYNLGRPNDFGAAQNIFLKTYREEVKEDKEYKKEPEFNSFFVGDKEHAFRDFNKIFFKKNAKTPRVDQRTERLFLEEVYKKLAYTCFVIDDARPIFRNGIKAEFLQLFSRINHAGRDHIFKEWKGGGVDVYLVFHSLNLVNTELFDYASEVISFKYSSEPNFGIVENKQVEEQLKKSFIALKKAEKYSYTITDIKLLKTHLYKPI